jgi:PAS domain S-box-containing protein
MASTPRLEFDEPQSDFPAGAEAILAAVVFGAQEFLTHSDFSGLLGKWLEQLGVATGAGQVRIFENERAAPGEPIRSSLRAQWIAPGANPGSPFDALQGIPFREAGCGRWEEMLARGESVIGNVADCPECERPILHREGIASVAIVPVFVDEKWHGFIGFAECRNERTWSEAERSALSAAARIYGAALERQEMERRLEAAMVQEKLAASIGEVVTSTEQSLDNVLQSASVRIAQILDADLVRIWSLNQDATVLFSNSGAFPLGEKLMPSEVAMCACAVGRIADNGKPEHWDGEVPEVWPRSTEITRGAGLRYGVGYPLTIEGRVVGVVIMLHRDTPPASAAEGLASVTDELALAIERSRATRALSLTENRYRRLVEGTVEGICLHDGKTLLDGNPSIANMVGYELADIIGRSPLEFIHPDYHPIVTKHLAENYLGAYEAVMLRKDGSTFPAEIKGRDFMHDGMKLRVASIRDITERKDAEATAKRLQDEQTARELAERSQSNARFMLDATRILSSSFDTTTTLNQLAHLAVSYISDSCVVSLFEDGEMHRIAAAHADPAKEELLDLAIDLWDRQWRGEHPMNVQQRSGEPFIVSNLADSELELMAHDPEHRRVLRALETRSFMSTPIMSGGKLIGTMMFSAGPNRDEFGPDDLEIAQELGRRAALALQNAQSYHDALAATSARDEVLAIVAHDLRNPLNTISMSSSLALDEEIEPLTVSLRKQFEIIRRSSEHMNRLIQDLLDATRLQSGQLALEKTLTAPSAIVSEAAEILTPLAVHSGITFETHVKPDLPRVHADKIRLLQVLSNLVGNALKFTPRGGLVSLWVGPREGSVCFIVNDSGPGIAEDQVQHIFGRFWQARKTDRRGLGLGLAIAKGIVDAHGGRIWVETRPGEGSSFLFTIPCG